MASSMMLNPEVEMARLRDVRKNKKKKGLRQRQNKEACVVARKNPKRWRTDEEEQLYSSKLLQELRQLRVASPNEACSRGRAVREAADRVLAVAAKGQTKWSRAILTNRLKLKFAKRRRVRAPRKPPSRKHRINIMRLKCKTLPAVQRKVRALGRLVPGCRAESYPVILEEASDYISAMKMQVRAMTSLLQQLSSSDYGVGMQQ